MGRLMPELRGAAAPPTASIFISTGELSGEMHAAYLVRALQALRHERGLPPASVTANGSLRLAEAGAELLHDVGTWSEMGLWHNLVRAQFFYRIVTATVRHIIDRRPDMVLLVDSRVLNLSLARLLRQRGYSGKIVYYVAPVMWQSCYDERVRQKLPEVKRFQDVKRYCDFAIPIYPVSLQAYEQLGIPHAFPGHPLCELARPSLSDDEFSALTGIEHQEGRWPLIIGALVGSRRGEIQCIARHVFRALALIEEAFADDEQLRPHVVSPVAHPDLMPAIVAATRAAGLSNVVFIEPQHGYDLMARARLMIVKNGTGLHECTLMRVPAIMCYRIPDYLAWFLRHVQHFSMPFFGLPNLLAGRAVVPELIQEECNATRIADLAGSLLFEQGERAAMLQSFAELHTLMCRPQPLRRAAELVAKQLPG